MTITKSVLCACAKFINIPTGITCPSEDWHNDTRLRFAMYCVRLDQHVDGISTDILGYGTVVFDSLKKKLACGFISQ